MFPTVYGRLTEAAATATKVKAGAFVSWPASKGESKGRVISVHSNGKPVPGLPHQVIGTTESPAARVQLYAKTATGWEPTGTYLGHGTSGLTAIDDLPVAATEAVVAGSFDDIRSNVQDAIRDRLESLGADVSVYVTDIGATWAVYVVNYGDDLWMCDYTIDGTTVTLSDPIEVTKVTTYVPDVDPMAEATSDRVESRVLEAKGVDANGGRIFGMQLIAFGTSKNGTHYTEAVLAKAAPLYEGAKAYDHHRTDAEHTTSTVAGVVGHYENVQVVAGRGLEADLHLLPSAVHAAELLSRSLENQAKGLPPLIGASHDVYARWRASTVDGRQVREATDIQSVNSVDLVANPSAGGQATRLVAGGPDDVNQTTPKENPPMKTLKQLLAQLRTTEAAGRAALLADPEHISILAEADITTDQVLALVATVPAPTAPTTEAVRSTEAAVHVKASAMADVLVDAALRRAKLDAKFTESVTGDLGDTFTEAELQASIVRVRRAVEAAGITPIVNANIQVTEDQHDKHVAALDAMLDPRKAGGFKSLREAHAVITGARAADLFSADYNRQILQECQVGNYDSERSTESVTTTTFSYILGDSITRRMIAEYMHPNLQVWRQLVSSIVPVNDFRQQKIEAMGGYGVLPDVLQGGTYNPLTTPSNEEATYTLTKRGGTEDLTIETIANDDLRMVQRIPQKLGLAAAQTLYRFVFDIFDANPTLTRDSVALFNSGHANTATTALSSTGLEAIRLKMRKQAAYGDTSDILSLTPKFLLVPPELEALAFQLCTSAVAIPSGAPVGAASNTPNLHQGMTPIIVDYWSSTSTTEWFLLADPSMAPTIELGFFNGQEDPQLFVQSDPNNGASFTADKVTYKIRHIYSGIPIDYRAFQRGNV